MGHAQTEGAHFSCDVVSPFDGNQHTVPDSSVSVDLLYPYVSFQTGRDCGCNSGVELYLWGGGHAFLVTLQNNRMLGTNLVRLWLIVQTGKLITDYSCEQFCYETIFRQ